MAKLTLTVTNFIFKLISTMLVLWVAHVVNRVWFFGGWGYFSTALIIAIVGLIVDMTVLPFLGNSRTLAVDFVVNTLLIWFVPVLWNGPRISFLPTLICSAVITVLEAGIHRFINRTNRLVDQAEER
ncbi:DUF2512 family protein [Alicyclobacillus dauci]|uniref:YndM family protein n=1 Tax=Alicyclobacillus dauci TaxID=1475485 RepID=A0ABY6Z612_9BACL|nr:DUF2512 family protein [Alicyclobacillus dauci]WAH38311.1 YndM family protein [Alicyclobacillus dauci]